MPFRGSSSQGQDGYVVGSAGLNVVEQPFELPISAERIEITSWAVHQIKDDSHLGLKSWPHLLTQ